MSICFKSRSENYITYVKVNNKKMYTTNISKRQTTMLNLQTKRTLPRQVIKWMQGLDLSYSIKDYRKDMNNGYLLGEIISRYEPGKIPMHAFQNSQNPTRRDNNWIQLRLFFSKHSIKGVKIEENEYDKIMYCNDPKSQQLFQFICRLYSACTKRALPESAPQVDLPPTQTNNPNLTASYLLKDDGLEKLNNSGNQSQSVNLNNSGSIDEQVRVPTRKIAPNNQPPNQVDIKSIGVWGEGNKQTSKRKSWNVEVKDQSNYSEDNIQNERFTFNYLNDIIEECLNSSQKFEPNRKLLLQNPNFTPTQILKNHIASIDPELISTFLSQVQMSLNELIPIILKQVNQIWKFFTYFLNMLRFYPQQSAELNLLCDLIGEFARNAHERQPKRINKVFLESILQKIISEVRASNSWRKRQKIMGLVYDFGGRDTNEKKVVLYKLKVINYIVTQELIKSSNALYLEWLSVLIKEEKTSETTSSVALLEDFLYYAFQNLNNASVMMRSASLKIIDCYVTINPSARNVEEYFVSHAGSLTQTREPEHLHLICSIYFAILEATLNSNAYQSLIKGSANTNLIKVYNPDHERQTEELKNKINLICQSIFKLYSATQNSMAKLIIGRKSVSFLSESRFMMNILLQETSGEKQKCEQFIRSEPTTFEFKTLEGQLESIEISVVQEHCNEILIGIIGIVSTGETEASEYIHLINYCLDHINIKKINMEVWDDVALHIARPLCTSIPSQELGQASLSGVKKLLSIYFNFDMKIKQLNQWLSQALYKVVINRGQQNSKEFIQDLSAWFEEQYGANQNELVRYTVDQINDSLQAKGFKDLIQFKRSQQARQRSEESH